MWEIERECFVSTAQARTFLNKTKFQGATSTISKLIEERVACPLGQDHAWSNLESAPNDTKAYCGE